MSGWRPVLCTVLLNLSHRKYLLYSCAEMGPYVYTRQMSLKLIKEVLLNELCNCKGAISMSLTLQIISIYGYTKLFSLYLTETTMATLWMAYSRHISPSQFCTCVLAPNPNGRWLYTLISVHLSVCTYVHPDVATCTLYMHVPMCMILYTKLRYHIYSQTAR